MVVETGSNFFVAECTVKKKVNRCQTAIDGETDANWENPKNDFQFSKSKLLLTKITRISCKRKEKVTPPKKSKERVIL